MKTVTKLWIGIAVLIILAPLGLILPECLRAGAAWGEWGVGELQELIGYIPAGLQKLAGIWHAPFPDYAFRGEEGKGLARLSAGYIVSAVAGVAITALAILALGKFLAKRDEKK